MSRFLCSFGLPSFGMGLRRIGNGRLDLTRFSGHITVTQRGVQNVEARQEIYTGVPVPDSRAGASWARDPGAFQGIWSFGLVDKELGQAGCSGCRYGRSRFDKLGTRGTDEAKA